MDYLTIIEVSKDRIGRYLKLEVEFPETKCMIRWGLDSFTYLKIKEVVSTKYFDSLAVDYRYELIPFIINCKASNDVEADDTYYLGRIRCLQGKNGKNINFECSKLFAGNMESFRNEVKSVDDVEHLFWDNF